MKTARRIVPAVVMALALTLILTPGPGARAEDGMDASSVKRAQMETLVDQFILSREAKHAMLESRSDTVRKDAQLSCDKADFCRLNRDRLVNELMSRGYDPKPEQVQRFLQNEYFRSMAEGTFVRRQ